MKKRLLSIILTTCMVLSCGAVPGIFASAANTCSCENTPIIYVRGRVTIQKYNPETGLHDGDEVFDDGDYISRIFQECLPDLAKGILTGNWDEYCEKVLDIILPAFDDFAPDLEGNIPEATDNLWSWSPEKLPAAHNAGTRYEYRIDTRKSMLDLADDLNTFVETVKQKTGHDKFIFYSRSMGPALLFAYFYKYQRPKNYADVESVHLSMSSAPSNVAAESLLSGNVKVDGASLNRYITTFGDTIDGFLSQADMDIINDAFEVLRTQYGIEMTAALGQSLYNQLKDKLFAKVIKAYWGRHLGHLAQVNEHFDEAMDYLFGEEGDKEKYAYYINDATEYHNTVGVNAIKMLEEIDELGKPVSILADYGYQQAPVGEGCDLVGDETVGVKEQTFGATVSKVDGTLSKSYIKERTEAGYGDYISPDKQIDGSTAMFPERTWYLKNNNHDWYAPIENMELAIMRSKGAKVGELEGYPRFTYIMDSQILPAGEVNPNDVDWGVRSTDDPVTAGKDLFSKVKIVIDSIVKIFINFIRGFRTGESFKTIQDLAGKLS